MINWVKQLGACIAKPEEVVLVTVFSTKGSTPRESGTKMIVSMSGIHGTIGGGNLEYQSAEIARQRLSSVNCKSWRRYTHRFLLGASLGQCCGGSVNVLFELVTPEDTAWVSLLEAETRKNGRTVVITPLDNEVSEKRLISQNELVQNQLSEGSFDFHCARVAKQLFNEKNASDVKSTKFLFGESQEQFLVELIAPSDFHIILFGAGHVGTALINVLSGVDCTITWVDSREEQYPELTPDNTILQFEEEPEDAVVGAPSNSYYIVMTHCHQLDLRICAQILQRNDVSYCGLIGSASKRRTFDKRLQTRGFTSDTLNNLTCPIGISGINSKEPGEIAIAIAGEILRFKSNAIEHDNSMPERTHPAKILSNM